MFKEFLQKLSHKPSKSPPDPAPLLAAIESAAAKDDSPEARERVYRELLNSWLWICVPELANGGQPGMMTVTAGPGMKISVATPTNARGVRVLPVFTDVTALANYDPNSPQTALPAIELFKMALQLGVAEIVINAFDPIRKPIRPGGTVTRREFEPLAAGMIPKSTPDGKGQVLTAKRAMQVAIGRCKIPVNPDIKVRLQQAAKQCPELNKIFRYQMLYIETKTVNEVFGLVCNARENRFREIVSVLMSSIQPSLKPNQHVDFTQLRADQLSIIQKHGELLYEQ
jgi:hypothetical protein